MKVVILAAGQATRLGSLAQDCPKYLLKIGDKTLAEHQLDVITRLPNIDNIIIVIGYRGNMISSKIGNNYNGVKISYIYNERYKDTEMNYSLYLARNEILHQPFIYLVGDIIFHNRILKKLLKHKSKNCIPVDKTLQSKHVDSIVSGYNGSLLSLYAKIHGDLSLEIKEIKHVVGEPVMMIKFDEHYGEYLVNAIYQNGFSKEAKHLMYVFADMFPKFGMDYFQVEDPWVEIDNLEDLEKAKKQQRRTKYA